MAGVGSAIGQAWGEAPFHNLVFSWQPVATIRNRPITLLDCQLEGTQLTVLDAAKWVGKIKCPSCNCAEQVVDAGWHSNATSSKGGGSAVHTQFMMSKKRLCKQCNTRWFDHREGLGQLPTGISKLIPVERTERSGLEQRWVQACSALLPEGVPFQRLLEAFNQGLHTSHAQLSKGFYEQLVSAAQGGILKMGQVRCVSVWLRDLIL